MSAISSVSFHEIKKEVVSFTNIPFWKKTAAEVARFIVYFVATMIAFFPYLYARIQGSSKKSFTVFLHDVLGWKIFSLFLKTLRKYSDLHVIIDVTKKVSQLLEKPISSEEILGLCEIVQKGIIFELNLYNCQESNHEAIKQLVKVAAESSECRRIQLPDYLEVTQSQIEAFKKDPELLRHFIEEDPVAQEMCKKWKELDQLLKSQGFTRNFATYRRKSFLE